MKALINVRLYDYHTYIERGYVIFDENIVTVGSMSDFKGCDTIIDGQGKYLIPAFVNFHTHLYAAFARGFNFNASPTTFLQTLESIWWRLDRELTIEDAYWSAVALSQESLLKGVVGLMDHHASGEITGSTEAIEKGMTDCRVHGRTCFEVSDRFSLSQALTENKAMVRRTGGPIGLHASMTLSDETLKRIKETFQTNPIHCHVSESMEDQCFYNKTPVERLFDTQLIQPNSLLAHCVHITEEDAAHIAQSGAAVVLNPRSNQNNGVGLMHYGRLKRYKIPVVVGTDGLGSDIAQSWQALYYATKSDERCRDAMALKDVQDHIKESYRLYEHLTGLKLGVFQPGYRFDALLVPYNHFTPVTPDTVFAHLFFGIFDDLKIQKLWCGGELLVDGYQLTQPIQVPETIARALWDRLEVKDE